MKDGKIMKIIAGPASNKLGIEVATLLKMEAVPLVFKSHPDGESYVRLEGSVSGEEVVIVHTTSPPQDTRLIQLALISDAARRNGAEKITAVVPYLAYARQDKVFLKGEAASIEVIARMLKASGISMLISINVHKSKVLERFPFPAKTISAIPLLAQHFKERGYDKAFSLGPDKGAAWLAEEARSVLGGESGYLEKQRDLYTGKIATKKNKSLNLEGKTVIIFDDVISTGGTVAAASRISMGLGAREVHVACVHPLLIGEASKRIIESGARQIVGTDSVASPVSVVSLAPLLSHELGKKGV